MDPEVSQAITANVMTQLILRAVERGERVAERVAAEHPDVCCLAAANLPVLLSNPEVFADVDAKPFALSVHFRGAQRVLGFGIFQSEHDLARGALLAVQELRAGGVSRN